MVSPTKTKGHLSDENHQARGSEKIDEHNNGRLLAYLREAGLRPTQQRLALVELLFGKGNRHVTAESLFTEALGAGFKISLATVYNTLHTFTSKGLLREISIDSGRSYFDTNIEEHHHFYLEKSRVLKDIEQDEIGFTRLPATPDGAKISRVDVVIRVNG